MKYNIFKISAMCLGVFALTACSDWLDPKKDSQIEESALFESVGDIQLAVNGVYADLCADPYDQLQTIHQGAGTDCELIDGFATEAESGENERAGMNYNASPGWAKIGTLWEKQYKTIEDCNRIIDGINASELTEDETAMKCSAEARVIRAMVYLDLIRVFGDIPFRWDAAKSDLSNVNQGKTDRDAILDKLIEDLEEVVKEGKLPWCGQVTQEHINMGYAKGLLANIYMTRAGYAIRENDDERATAGGYSSSQKVAAGYIKAAYSDDNYKTLRPSDEKCNELYSKAEQHLKDIIDHGTHNMNTSFAGFWEAVNKLQLDPSYESMFEIPMGFGLKGELGYTVGVRMNEVTKDYGFQNSSGKIKTTAVQLYSYAPCDTRRDITCATFSIRSLDRRYTTKANMTVTKAGIPDYVKDEKLLNEKSKLPEGSVAIAKDEVPDGQEIEVRTETGSDATAERLLGNSPFEMYIGKWDVRKMSNQWLQQNRVSSLKFGYGINVVRMRYPQILLWYAECLAYRGDYSGATDYIKQVHLRAYSDAVNAYTGRTPDEDKTDFENQLKTATDYESTLDLIDKENRLEFCGECFRKWDLIRWNRLHDNIVFAKKYYVAMKSGGKQVKGETIQKVFQDKVYFRYKGYTAAKDAEGKIFYWAPEKEIDLRSITWYGVSGSNKEKSDAPGNTWINEHGYRYAKSTAYDEEKGKGYKYNGFGKDNKDMNARSYANDAFGKDYEKLDSYLPSICSGLVGTCDTNTGDCDDSDLDVKNCYLMPIGTLVIQSSNGRLYNSYKWNDKK